MNKKPTTEEITQAVAIIRQHNRWRRGDDEDIEMGSPRQTGIAMDTLCDAMEEALERIGHAEILLGDLSSGYWRSVLNSEDSSGENIMGERVAQYWAQYAETNP